MTKTDNPSFVVEGWSADCNSASGLIAVKKGGESIGLVHHTSFVCKDSVFYEERFKDMPIVLIKKIRDYYRDPQLTKNFKTYEISN